MIALNITKRFIYLLSFGFIFLILGGIFKNSLTVFVLYNLCCIILLLVDYFISAFEKEITIERFGDENLSIYEKTPISFRVYNKANYKLYMELKDEVPDFHFKTEKKIMSGIVLPREKKDFSYEVIPTKRGSYTFKNLHIRYEGRLRLSMRIYKVDLSREYKVYPNLKNLRKYRMSVCNNRLFKQGQKTLKLLGRGTSFESLKEYVPGDDYRKINWKATARSNKPIVNQYEPEKNQHVYMFIDTGRPMSYTIRGYRKLDMVVNTSLVLSDIINQNGDKSALLIFNSTVSNMIMPGKGAGHRNKILETLYHIEASNDTSNYEDAFYYFKKKERHRSIIFIFTDFDTVEEAENMLRSISVISKNNLVIVMLIKNYNLEKLGDGKIRNSEELFNKGVALELMEERRKIINLLNRRGVLCVETEAEKLEYGAVNKYIQLKNRSYL